ncbi:MAG: cupin domain-containing protein [Gaiellaceae bacterium]
MTLTSGAHVVTPDDAAAIRSPVGDHLKFMARGEETGGALAAMDVTVSPGEGPPLHVHTREDEFAYVIEGEFRWKLGDELRDAPAGSFVFIPRGLAHCFQNVGAQPGRQLVMFSPSGMEGFFDRLSDSTELDLEAFTAAAGAHGMEVVGPPLAQSDPL